jgi:hypothetical protein
MLGQRDVTLLAIYSHMVNNEMYTPDYTLAHLVAFQIRAHFDKLGAAAAAAASGAPSADGSAAAAKGCLRRPVRRTAAHLARVRARRADRSVTPTNGCARRSARRSAPLR